MGHTQLDLDFWGIANALQPVIQERIEDESWGSVKLSTYLRAGDSSRLLAQIDTYKAPEVLYMMEVCCLQINQAECLFGLFSITMGRLSLI